MRRIKLVLTVGVMMAAILVFSAGPAMADDFDFDGFDDGDVECCFVAGGDVFFLVEVDDDIFEDNFSDFSFEDFSDFSFDDDEFCDCDDDDGDDDDDFEIDFD